MNQPVVWVTPSKTLREVAKIMIDRDYSQLPVFDGAKNVGRVTDEEIIKLVNQRGSLEVAMLKVKALPKYGRPFREVSQEDSDLSLSANLEHDLAVLVRTGDQPTKWGIVTRADILKSI